MMAAHSGLTFQQDFFHQRRELWNLTELFVHLPRTCFFAKDRESRFVRMNAMNLELYGVRDESAILGKTDRDFHPKALAEAYIAEDRRVMTSGKVLADQIWMVPYLDGRFQWFVSSKIPLVSSTGKTSGIAGVMYPIDTPDDEITRFKRLAPAMKYLDANFRESTPLKDVAKMCDLSLTHFNRLFQQLLKMSPSEYRTTLRVQQARHLLRTPGVSLSQIAADSGFSDQSHLNKQFRKSTGMTPGQYREEFGATT